MANKYSWGNPTTPARLRNEPGSSASNCIPAPRSGTFSNISAEDARFEMEVRAEMYAEYVAGYISGRVGKERLFTAFAPPVYGAFGERL